jgi:ABC-type siderophore export system fused ATPase/permease subunit
LKAKGKGVLVVTHDDRYFHFADRILKLEGGRLEVTYDRSWTREGEPGRSASRE